MAFSDRPIDWNTPKRQRPTAQQTSVVKAMQSGGDHACIAFAGSGKTATGVEVAHAMQTAGYLLVFNRSARADAAPRLPASVQAITGHSLAFQYVIEPSDGYQKKLAGTLDPEAGPQLTASTVAKALKLKSASDPDMSASQLAMATLKTIEAFQISSDAAVSPEHVPDSVLPIQLRADTNAAQTRALRERIADHATQLWKLMASEYSWVPINHDSYLKIFQLRQPNLGAKLWILDEYQDTTPAVDALMRIQDGQKLYIGDPYQAIYGWRGAIDALQDPINRGVPKHYLNDSFRYNHQIAGMATLLLRSLGETVPVRGQPRELLQTNLLEAHTVICRSNLSIVVRAAQHVMRNRRVYVDGGIPEATRQRLKSALALFEGRLDDVKISVLRELGSWAELVSYTENLGDKAGDTGLLVSLIERYRDALPELMAALARLPRRDPKHPEQVTLITAHRAKGRQWPFVELCPDLALSPDILRKLEDNAPLTDSEREAIHVLYVALTRAELGINIPPAIKANFRSLHQLFAQPTDDTQTFVADTVAPDSPDHRQILQNARTAEFIRKHRRQP